ncbi:MAG TPA: hypothetical protein VFP98_07475, partial [Candidatus Polarisedimenticolia bacterium]|nr:hypothetical protein [Candidatus Polarisedimenticolia bacterium]
MLESTLAALGRHRWLAAMAILIPFTGAVVLALSLPGLYRATATILVQRDQPVSGGTPAQPADVETRLRTIREEVLSRRRLDALVEKFGLYPELRGRAHREASIDRMRKDIQIQLKGPDSGAAPSGTIAFSLGFRGADPVLAASVANALAESYVQENLRISGRQARGAAEALEAQLSEVAKRLDEQEVQIVQYQTAHNGELPQQLVVNMARMQQLEMQLQINRETRLRYLDRADFAGRQAADPRYAGVSGNPETPAARLARLKQELADLRATYHDNYPDIARISKEISA